MLSVAVADIVPRGIHIGDLRALDALMHLLIGVGVSDRLFASGHNQGGAFDAHEFFHEIVCAHVQYEARDEGGVV